MSTGSSEDENLRDPFSDEEPQGDEISPQIEEIEEESVDPARWEYTSEQFNKLGRLKLFNIYQRHGRTIFYHYSGANKTKFVPALLATFLEIMNPVITIRPSVASSKDYGDMWYYDWDKGTYVPNAETYFIEKVKNIWGDSYNIYLIVQTFFNIQAETYIDREQFDLDLNFIPVKNGVLKLEKNIVDDIDQFFSELPIESGWKESLVPNNPNIYVINRIPVEYNPSALCNNWLEFLSKTFDVPDIAFLQEWCGSILYRKIFGVGKP